jgi:hypothetical protein
MSNPLSARPAPSAEGRPAGAAVSLHHIFLVFLSIGATSVGGGLGGLIAAAVLVLLLLTRLNPALLILASAVFGLLAHLDSG